MWIDGDPWSHNSGERDGVGAAATGLRNILAPLY